MIISGLNARNMMVVLSLAANLMKTENFLFVARSPDQRCFQVFTQKLSSNVCRWKQLLPKTWSNQIPLDFLPSWVKFEGKVKSWLRLLEIHISLIDLSRFDFWVAAGEEVAQSRCDFLLETFHNQLPNALEKGFIFLLQNCLSNIGKSSRKTRS